MHDFKVTSLCVGKDRVAVMVVCGSVGVGVLMRHVWRLLSVMVVGMAGYVGVGWMGEFWTNHIFTC